MGTDTGPDIYGYTSHAGAPRGQLLNFFPQFVIGTYTGKGQATWTVTGNSQYVVYGGEFLKVDGISQQGIVRFGVQARLPAQGGPADADRHQLHAHRLTATPPARCTSRGRRCGTATTRR